MGRRRERSAGDAFVILPAVAELAGRSGALPGFPSQTHHQQYYADSAQSDPQVYPAALTGHLAVGKNADALERPTHSHNNKKDSQEDQDPAHGQKILPGA